MHKQKNHCETIKQPTTNCSQMTKIITCEQTSKVKESQFLPILLIGYLRDMSFNEEGSI